MHGPCGSIPVEASLPRLQGITAVGAQTICGVLAENGRLASLALASNPLGDDGERMRGEEEDACRLLMLASSPAQPPTLRRRPGPLPVSLEGAQEP